MRLVPFLGIAVLAMLLSASSWELEAAAPSADPNQPHSDIFPCGAGCDIQVLNPVNVKAKATRTASYRLVTMPGCSAPTVPGDLAKVQQDMASNLGFTLSRNDATFDFTIRINCGSEQVRYCGSVTIFCLGRGYPYIADIEVSDIISTYYDVSRQSILQHELFHALAGFNEQYCSGNETSGGCKGLGRFGPAPNWRDVMNTGVESRHTLEAIEIGRWQRTMYEISICTLGPVADWGGVYDPCANGGLGLWVGPSGWDFNPSTNAWQDKAGFSEWCCQQPYGGYYNRRLAKWYWDRPTVWSWSDSDPTWRCVTSCP